MSSLMPKDPLLAVTKLLLRGLLAIFFVMLGLLLLMIPVLLIAPDNLVAEIARENRAFTADNMAALAAVFALAAALVAVAAAITDPAVLARYRAKVATVPGSECLWWTGAVAGRSDRERTDGGGHGRFWYAPGRVIIAHRFAFAVMNGVDALAEARLLGHRCHNPLCQRISRDHVVESSAAQNRREWSVQRRLPYSPLADPRGPRRRARELRDLAREDPQLVADDLARLQELLGEQLTLW